MPVLFGHQFSQPDLAKRMGQPLQVAGVRLMDLSEGLERGVRIADVRTGSGLRFQVSLDRGMDLSLAEYKGMPLAWRSAQGDVHPSFYDPHGSGWARSFPGGLMTGCGITHAGRPCVDEGEELGMHGRLSNIPATNVSHATEWKGDRCFFRIKGEMRETSLFKDQLLLQRVIETELGVSTITFHDTVLNEGIKRSPLMMLYHINTGWPLVDEGTALLLNANLTKPRDAAAEKGIDTARKMTGPIPDYQEQVFFHDLEPDAAGNANVLLANRKLHTGLFVRFRMRELPRFVQWKMMGEGTYVLGLEPANCWTQGRVKERERGTLQFLDPGERREFFLQIGILEGRDSLDQFIQQHQLT